MRYTLALLAFVLPAAAGPHTGIPHSELSLAGISLDATEQQVRERLGRPAAVSEEADHLDRHLHYPHLLVSFTGGVIGSVYSRSPEACTPAGLCPGDRLERVVALYGPPRRVEREAGEFWEYHTGFPCWLQLAPEGGRVGSIRAVCQP